MPKKSQPTSLINDDATLTYESALSRIEEIAALLEKGEATVDESLKLFEESVALVAFCNKKLAAVEQKIIKITEGN